MTPASPAAAAPPLWSLLQATAGVVRAVGEGTSATPALAAVPAPLRAGTQALAFQALRHLGRAQALRTLLARRAPPAPADALLRTGLALCWDPAQAPYEPHTLVNQAVEAAKRDRATAGQSSFINACLRRFLREREALVVRTEGSPVARWNHPSWWITRVRQDHPQQWEDILRASNAQPPMTLRVNARRATPQSQAEVLAAAGIAAYPAGTHGLVLQRPLPVHQIPGFDDGVLSVQDAAAQLAAPLLLRGLAPAGDRLRILDACAAPGGKTAHLLELADADVTALDVDPQRCERITQTLQRLGLPARVLAADAARPEAWWDGVSFDGILLDAPCTASGIVRRHPDVRWLRRESDIASLAAAQAALLTALWPLVRPGGRLLYCTCSIFRAEGQAQIGSFLAHNTDAVLGPAPGHLIPQSGAKAAPVPDNSAGDHDGFFYAVLDKRPG
ncbi:MAG: 16S rRNA (cytosine(967)-C(5))-methyltransferase RsmB [Ramlibacter sp.]